MFYLPAPAGVHLSIYLWQGRRLAIGMATWAAGNGQWASRMDRPWYGFWPILQGHNSLWRVHQAQQPVLWLSLRQMATLCIDGVECVARRACPTTH